VSGVLSGPVLLYLLLLLFAVYLVVLVGNLRGLNLVRLRDLVGAPRGRIGLFFRVPGRGGHLGGPATKWGGRGRPAGHAAVPPAVPR
jgi:hypothetical protein